MAAKLTRLTHKIAIQLHLAAESCTICSCRSRRPVRKLLDTTSYIELVSFVFSALYLTNNTSSDNVTVLFTNVRMLCDLNVSIRLREIVVIHSVTVILYCSRRRSSVNSGCLWGFGFQNNSSTKSEYLDR
jgi:hypothetical protein